MQGTKAMEDGIGTFKVSHSFVEYGMAQGYVPVIKHQRTCHIWVNGGGWYTTSSVNTETIEVRARLNPKLRRK